MANWFAIGVALFLFAGADIPRLERLRPPTAEAQPFPSGEEIPLFRSAVPAASDQQSAPQTEQRPRKATLQEESKLELIRYVSGEFAKARKSLPAGKQGLPVYIGKPWDDEFLDRAVATHGAAIHMGDQVQITKLDFRDRSIIVDLNGGGRGKRRWLDHLQIGFGGGMPMPQTRVSKEDQGPPGLQPGTGSTIYLEFDKPVPDLTPDDLKQLLSPFLNFAKQRSAAVQWYDTLPPDIKKAIQDRRPVIGMDREMVIAAIGKPEHKVRERDAQGDEIEDWIYGTPPDKTVFVRFKGDRVSAIEQFPK
jgi:hypothetical protein